MTAINDLLDPSRTQLNTDVGNVQNNAPAGQQTPVLPETSPEVASKILSETPTLPAPRTSGGTSPLSIMSMDEETLMMMLGTENAETMKQSSIGSIKAKAAMRQSHNKTLIENLQKQAEKLENQSIWDKIGKAFKIIAAVAGIIGGIAGAVFSGGSSLAIAGACIGVLLGAESILSTATDGKISLGALCTEICGEKAGPWVAMGITLALSLFTLGTGFANTAAASADKLEKVAKVVGMVKQVANITAATGQIGAGVTGIGSAINRYNISELKVSQKELEAMMTKLAQAMDTDTKFLEDVLEKSQSAVETVKEIIDTNAAATTAIVAATPGTGA